MRIVNVVFNCDDSFLVGFKNALKTLFRSNKNIFFNIYFIGTLSTKNLKKIKGFIEKNGHKFIKIDVDDNLFASNIDRNQYFFIGLKRLLIPYILNDCDRVLYLDSDIIVNGTILDVYDYNINNSPIACVLDLEIDNEYVKAFKNDHSLSLYFNSGVILFDCDKIRKLNNTQNLIKIVRDAKIYRYPDQDILNILYKGVICQMPFEYNCQITPHQNITEEQLLTKSIIIHYLGTKPWCYGYPLFSKQSVFYWKKTVFFPFFKILFLLLKTKWKSFCIHVHNFAS